jgi:hypothetical protein
MSKLPPPNQYTATAEGQLQHFFFNTPPVGSHICNGDWIYLQLPPFRMRSLVLISYTKYATVVTPSLFYRIARSITKRLSIGKSTNSCVPWKLPVQLGVWHARGTY